MSDLADKQAFPYAQCGKGMTYREWLAGMILAGCGWGAQESHRPEMAVKIADELIEELEK